MNKAKFTLLTAGAALAMAFTLLTGCGEEKVVNLRELQKRDGVYVVPETQKPYSGKFVTTRDNVIKEAGTLKKGKLHGEITTYREDGSVDNVQTPADFTDPRDKKTYRTVKIGSQTWMAENLNYEAEGSKCYDNNPSNCVIYGRLYNWDAAMKACPSGWHLPNRAEWEMLGGDAKELKANSGWNKNGNGAYVFGFSALPGGYGYSGGGFDGVGDCGLWWQCYENNSSHASHRRMYSYDEYACWINYGSESYLFSVRCLQD